MPRSKKKKAPSKISNSPSTSSCSQKTPVTSLIGNEKLLMVQRAISSAKKHSVNLKHGTPNPASGNCAIESAIFNLNDRDCFHEKLPFSVDYYRKMMNRKTWQLKEKRGKL